MSDLYERAVQQDLRLSRCEGKEAFSSWWAADRVRRRARKRWLQVYRCRNCRQWHLGADRAPSDKD